MHWNLLLNSLHTKAKSGPRLACSVGVLRLGVEGSEPPLPRTKGELAAVRPRPTGTKAGGQGAWGTIFLRGVIHSLILQVNLWRIRVLGFYS